MRTRRSSLPGGAFRLGSAVVLLGLGFATTAACAQPVRGKASLPHNNADFAHDPQITNLGVDAPVATSEQQSPSSPRSSDDSESSASSGSTLNDYLDSHGVSAYAVPSGRGLTVTVPLPRGWKSSQLDGASQQVSLELPADGGDGVYALMTVDVYRLSKNPPAAELVAAAKNSIAEAGSVQTTNDTPYQGNPSAAGIVTLTTKQGSRIVKVLRYTFVQDEGSATTYVVVSAVACGTDSWQQMRNDLLSLDSSISISG